MSFTAHFDPSADRLVLAGDCRMGDAPALVRALGAEPLRLDVADPASVSGLCFARTPADG